MENTETLMPLTAAQQDIFYDQLLHQDAPIYNVGGYFDIFEPDLPLLGKAQQRLISRHDVYGMRIVTKDNVPYQYFTCERTFDLPLVDFSGQADPQSASDAWLKQLFESPQLIIDTELFKSFILKLSDSHYRYVAFAHHLMTDGWGFARWVEYLGKYYYDETYEAQDLSWSEVVAEDESYRQSDKYGKDQQYWAERLAKTEDETSGLSPINNTLDKQSASSCRFVYPIKLARFNAIEQLALELKVGVSHLFIAVISAYFGYLNGQNAMTLGLPAHNRKGAKHKRTVGTFTTVSPFALEIDGQKPLCDWVRELAKMQKSDFRHQRYPLGQIYRDLGADQDTGALYQVVFNYLKLDSHLQIGQKPVSLVYLSHNHETQPIKFTLWQYADVDPVELQIDYRLDYFTEKEVAKIALRLDNVFDQLLESPDVLIEQLSFLSDSDYQQLADFGRWHEGVQSSANTLHGMFEEQVEKSPEAIAVSDADSRLSYLQLNQRAEQIALLLAENGVVQGDKVGLCLPRSCDLVAAMLAVLKLGGAYVPLDAKYPSSRLTTIVEDCRTRVILTLSEFARLFDKAFCLLLDKAQLQPAGQIESEVSTDSLAYLIYTSGSTGKPKGVMVSHRNAHGMLSWAQNEYDRAKLTQVLATTSINFDISVFEIFLPLSVGSQVVMADDILQPLHQDAEISLINTVPSAMKNLLEVGALQDSVKVVNLAGEPLSARLVNDIFANSKVERVYNLYGPSEDTVYSTYAAFDGPVDEVPAIGRTITQTQGYVLNAKQQLLPPGASGELYLGGCGVTQGYLNRPDETAKRFVTVEALESKDLLYRTGDLVRYNQHGELVYLGRDDEQVKIRGFRVEPGEIQTLLETCPGVKEALVVYLAKQQVIAAYVVVKSSQKAAFSLDAVRSYMSQKLPDYMCPSLYQVIDAFTLNANGKIDKSRLPDFLSDNGGSAVLETELERQLAVVWQQTLELESTVIGRDTNFFHIGGHSLSVARLCRNVQQQLGFNLDIRSVFENPGLREMAECLGGLSNNSDIPLSKDTKAPASYAQRSLWFVCQNQQASLAYHMHYAAKVKAGLEPDLLAAALNLLCQRHEALRTGFEQRQDGLYQVARADAAVKFTIHEQIAGQEAAQQYIEQILAADKSTAFDLTNDDLIRGGYIHCGDGDGVLYITAHHIAVDGWSVALLLKELNEAYQAQSEDEDISQIKLRYIDYANWQHHNITSGGFATEWDYWSNQLKDAPTLHSLPLDNTRPSQLGYQGQNAELKLDNELCTAINALANEHGLSLLMLIHGVLAAHVSYLSQCNDVVIGVPVANRHSNALQSLVGYVTNVVPLRTQIGDDLIVGDYLSELKTLHLQAQQHQSLPFEYLVEQLNPKRSQSHAPLVQLMISEQMNPLDNLIIAGKTLQNLTSTEGFSKFDLSLEIQPLEDGIRLAAQFNCALWHKQTIEQWLNGLRENLSQLSSNLEKPVFEFIAEAQAARAQQAKLLAPKETYPQVSAIHHLFEAFTKTQPEQIALCLGDEQVSYKALESKANRLAHYIHQHCADSTIIGLCMSRSIDTFVAMLAILKAGRTYVCIDPEYPEKRIGLIVHDSQMGLLLVDKTTVQKLNAHDVDLCQIDSPETIERLSGLSDSPLGVDIANQAAYMIYTSGSTGRPKAVEIGHSGLLNLAFYQRKTLGLQQQSRVLQYASISFDAACWEWIMALTCGAALHICPQSIKKDPLSLERFLVEQQITHGLLPPPLLAHLNPEANYGFEALLVGGDVLDSVQADRWSKHVPLFNAYGPSEASVCVSLGRIMPGEDVHIGRAIDNAQLYVLGVGGAPVPAGVVGELYIGGTPVGLGYFANQALTESCFLADPYNPGGKMYRTGDLVRFDTEGRLTFVSRVDNQVQLSGFRIELNEIEQCLNELSGVDSAKVLKHEAEQGNPLLIGYIKPTQADLDETELSSMLSSFKQKLRARLPGFMVPAVLMAVEHWPMTTNGKLDIAKLPEPEQQGDENAQTIEGEVGLALADIWSQLLDIEADSIDMGHNFFARGGHSLLLIKLQQQITERFAVNLDVEALLVCDCFADMVEKIQSAKTKPQGLLDTTNMAAQENGLSFAQQRLWFIDQLQGEQNQYLISAAFKITGKVPREDVEQCLNILVERHEILRTCYRAKGSEVSTYVLPQWKVTLGTQDFSDLSENEQTAALRTELKQFENQPFDLASDLMVRGLWLTLGKGQFVLALHFHHIAADGWSVDILLDEFNTLYRLLQMGERPGMTLPKQQYREFVAWQQARLKPAQMAGQKQYWLETLADIPTLHSLPLDNQRPQVLENTSFGKHTGELEAHTVTALTQLARSADCTLFMVLQALFALSLSRISREKDIVMGTPVAGRNGGQSDKTVGLFLNLLTLRTQIDETLPFSDYLQQVRQNHLNAHRHSELPFSSVVEALNPPRSLAHTPIFQILINMLNIEQRALTLGKAKVEALSFNDEFSGKYDITLYLKAKSETIEFQWHYNKQLFAEQSIELFAQEFSLLCRQVANRPQARLKDYLRAENTSWQYPTPVALPHSGLVHRMFEAAAMNDGHKTAVMSEDETWSRSTLNAQANRLGRYLIEANDIRPGDRVGVCMQRTPARVLAMLAILKSGGVIVPLSQELPQQRLTYVAKDAGLKLIICDSASEAFAGAICDETVKLNVERCNAFAGLSDENIEVAELNQDSTALIIYTSGSTGRPKGVVLPHKAVMNRAAWMLREQPFAPDDVSCHVTSMAFIRGMWELFVPLLGGNPLVLIKRETVKHGAELLSQLAKFNVSRIVTAPTLLKALLTQIAANDTKLPSLKIWFVSGEALSVAAATEFKQVLPEVALYNLYGSTEVMSDVMFHEVVDVSLSHKVPLGKAVDGVALSVVDEQMRPLKDGQLGELVVMGQSLADGYLSLPEVTAHSFVSLSQGRVYRTGDLARVNVKGQLEYCGRNDAQVKIRGYRIEPNETALALERLNGVRQSLVNVQAVNDENHLVAYVVVETCGFAKQQAQIVSELKTELGKVLPDYMVPSAIVLLEAFPTRANGKIDRSQLPKVTFESTAQFAAPQSKTEQVLAQIWREVLKLDDSQPAIGVNDSFFDLGGHSLLAMQVIHKVRERLDYELPVAAVLRYHTIKSLAVQLGGQSQPLELVAQLQSSENLVLSYAQKSFWLAEQMAPGQGLYNIAHGLRLRGQVDFEALEQAINQVVKRHQSLRSNFVSHNGEPVLEVVQERQIKLSVSVLNGQSNRESDIRQWLQQHAHNQFDLSKDCLLHAALLKVDDSQSVLLLTLHHIIADARSMALLAGEVEAFYRAAVENQLLSVAELSLQPSDHSAWQHRSFAAQWGQQQLAYWQAALADITPVHNLPLDHVRPPVRTYAGSSLTRHFDSQMGLRLGEFAAKQDCSLYVLLQSVFALLIGRWSNTEDVVMGTPVTLRHQQALEPVIGCFINTLVLRSSLHDNPVFVDYLGASRQRILNDFDHQLLPLEMLLDNLGHPRSSAYNPAFQILFNFHHKSSLSFSLPEVEVSNIELPMQSARYDLELSILQDEQDNLQLFWRYSSELFNRQTIERLATSFDHLLQQVLANPMAHIQQLSLMPDAALSITGGNRNPVKAVNENCLYQVFESHALRNPDVIACEYLDNKLSYGQLNAKANRLANVLRAQGIGAGDTVGLLVSRTDEVLTCLLAIMKTGACYLPLDPHFPFERLDYICRQSELSVLLTELDWLSLANKLSNDPLIIDQEVMAQKIAAASADNLNVEVAGTDLAYVIYTSGSTGLPKGIDISHRALCNALFGAGQTLGFNADDRLLAITTLAFDISALELFMPLFNGATVVIASGLQANEPQMLSELLETQNINYLQATPTSWQSLISSGWQGKSSLVQLAGGEALSGALASQLLKTGSALWNMYGPTEATIWIGARKVQAQDIHADNETKSVVIGGVFDNISTVVVSPFDEIQPVGVVGELCIGGVALAQGYRGRQDLTVTHFIDNPFETIESKRLYRTGDLVKSLGNGDFEFIGRCDSQIKLRGFRIEMGEIEAQLAALDFVADVACVVKGPVQGERIVGYFTAQNPYAKTQAQDQLIAEIKAHLSQKLPAYMVPTQLVLLEQLPQTNNGKIDRNALCAMNDSFEDDVVLPETSTEEQMLAIWSEVLGAQQMLSVTQSFFDAGGNSLLAARLVARVNEQFGVNTLLKDLFESNTVRDFSGYIDYLNKTAAIGLEAVAEDQEEMEW